MAAPPSGGVILVSLYHKAEDFASEETGRRGQPVVEEDKLQFIVPINCNSEIRFACEIPAA
jgi:hypothetical protein